MDNSSSQEKGCYLGREEVDIQQCIATEPGWFIFLDSNGEQRIFYQQSHIPNFLQIAYCQCCCWKY